MCSNEFVGLEEPEVHQPAFHAVRAGVVGGGDERQLAFEFRCPGAPDTANPNGC